MSGIIRDSARLKQTGEYFTPTELVDEILDRVPIHFFTDPTKKVLDPSCGDGQFLASVLLKKLQNGIDFATALNTLYGVDIMPDNIELCKQRLLCGRHDLRHIVDNNIVCANALDYNFKFNENG